MKNKTIKLKKDKKTDELYLDLKDLKHLLDIDKVKYYQFEVVYDVEDQINTAMITFYDKKKKIIDLNLSYLNKTKMSKV